MSPPPTILIYAELLSNVRQVSVACTLPSASTQNTKVFTDGNGSALTITHDGLTQTIILPGRVASSSQLPIHKAGTTDLSWRLPLANPSTLHIVRASDESIPWSASDLSIGSAISCRTCTSTIVEEGKLKIWKDLPSENWAEMMEFWHCHKPETHSHHDGDNEQHLTNRGYGASSRIAAQPGVGFVDLTSFLIDESDITGPSHSQTTPTSKSNGNGDHDTGQHTPSNAMYCGSCHTQYGVRADDSSSISIFKWQTSVSQKDTQHSYAPNLSQCVSAMLLATMSRSGCSKSITLPMKTSPSFTSPTQHSIASPTPSAPSILHIWLFNTSITFSSTASKSNVNAIKVFYRLVSQEDADSMLESMTSDVQDITLPSDAIENVKQLLSDSTGFVPETSRMFKEWKVGLLEKWDGGG
ncbi:ubiquitin-conjugating enzyme E2C-binding protein [Xylariaceae sp. FL1019]|nr:ubiquitin-conjugating enzyme E2C-binding protein [Xylariaceae sp. FL1019]